MAILRPAPPPETAEAFATALPAFLSRPQESDVLRTRFVGESPAIPRLEDLGDPGQRDRLLHDPQQIFVLGLDDAARSTGIRAAKPTGWRIFAGRSRGRTILGRVAFRPNFGWKMTAAYYGDQAAEVLDAAKELDGLPQVRGADYELRVLAVPGLNLEAYWLAARTPQVEDLVMPVPPMPPLSDRSADSGRVLTMANFLAAIRPMALLAKHAHARTGG
jgi:hypothetical protein